MSTTETQEEYQKEKRAIFVGGLLDTTEAEAVEKHFSKFGPIEEVNLIIDWVTGKSKRCAIVICGDNSTFKNILKAKKHNMNGRTVRVDEADQSKKGTKIVKTTKIFLGHVPTELEENDLREYFSVYGKIKHIKIINRDKMALEFSDIPSNGYLEFYRVQDAQKLLQDRHNLIIKGCKLFCQPFKAKNAQEGKFLKFISGMKSEMLEKALQMYFDMQASHVSVQEQIYFYNYFEQFVKGGGFSQQQGYPPYGNFSQAQGNIQNCLWDQQQQQNSSVPFQGFMDQQFFASGQANGHYGYPQYPNNRNYQGEGMMPQPSSFVGGQHYDDGSFQNQHHQQAQQIRNGSFAYSRNPPNNSSFNHHKPPMQGPFNGRIGYDRHRQYENKEVWKPLVNKNQMGQMKRGPNDYNMDRRYNNQYQRQGQGQIQVQVQVQGQGHHNNGYGNYWNEEHNYGYQENKPLYNNQYQHQQYHRPTPPMYQNNYHGGYQDHHYQKGFKNPRPYDNRFEFNYSEGTTQGPKSEDFSAIQNSKNGMSDVNTRASTQKYKIDSKEGQTTPNSLSPISAHHPLKFKDKRRTVNMSIRKFTEEEICHKGLKRKSALDFDDRAEQEFCPEEIDWSLPPRKNQTHKSSTRLIPRTKDSKEQRDSFKTTEDNSKKSNKEENSISEEEEAEEILLKEAISVNTKKE